MATNEIMPIAERLNGAFLKVPLPPIADTLTAEVLSASVAGHELASVSLVLRGSFERDGSRVAIDVTIVATVPAKVLPG
jgi:hypothetical protein